LIYVPEVEIITSLAKSTEQTLQTDRAECDIADGVVARITAVEHTLDLRVTESHCGRREAVGDVRLDAFVVTYVQSTLSFPFF